MCGLGEPIESCESTYVQWADARVGPERRPRPRLQQPLRTVRVAWVCWLWCCSWQTPTWWSGASPDQSGPLAAKNFAMKATKRKLPKKSSEAFFLHNGHNESNPIMNHQLLEKSNFFGHFDQCASYQKFGSAPSSEVGLWKSGKVNFFFDPKLLFSTLLRDHFLVLGHF